MSSEGRNQYFKKMFDKDCPTDGKALPNQIKALERAHEIRKFEIEMYWKRATYFWGFQIAIFAGLTASYKFEEPALTVIFAILGLITSVAWHYVNKGSKFWQENWELHIDLLEKECTGNLYKNVLCYANNKDDAYSVSRINLTTSRVFIAVWSFILFFSEAVQFFDIDSKVNCLYFVVLVVSVFLLVLLFYWLPKEWKSNFTHSMTTKVKIYGEDDVVIRDRKPSGSNK